MEAGLAFKQNTTYKFKASLVEKLRMILFVIVMGAVSAGLLVVINFYTSQRVMKNEELELKSSVMSAFDIAYKKGDIEEVFNQNVKALEKSSIMFYQSKNNEVAFMFSGSGFWGPITGIIALDSKLEAIKGIQIIHQEETPGLGGRITEKEFLEQFKGKKIVPSLVILSGSNKASKENEVDAVTGATMTSKALENLLNNEILKHREVWVK